MKVLVGCMIYACVFFYVLTNVLGLAFALAIQLLILSLLVFLGLVLWELARDR